MKENGIGLRVLLLGAPGEHGPHAERWRAAAREAGMVDALEFTGVIGASDLASALAATDVVILPDLGGPSSRRGVLAAALALGKATVAVDGPERWQELVDAGAVSLAPPNIEGLAEAVRRLLETGNERGELETRAKAFYDLRMSPTVLARELRGFLQARPHGVSAQLTSRTTVSA
jgi:glycosyltransferase involved in cell wall biosynthesis